MTTTQTYLCRVGWRNWVYIILDVNNDHVITGHGAKSKRQAARWAEQSVDYYLASRRG